MLGELLRRAREGSGVRLAGTAEGVGVSPARLRGIEDGATSNPDGWERLADLHGGAPPAFAAWRLPTLTGAWPWGQLGYNFEGRHTV
jgi:hypothetical protein